MIDLLAAAPSSGNLTTVPTLTELSSAVAGLEDFRAMGVVVFAVVLVLVALVTFLVIMLVRANKPVIETVIPMRIAMEAATAGLLALGGKVDSLINAVANLTRAVDENGSAARQARRQLDEVQARLDRIERARE